MDVFDPDSPFLVVKGMVTLGVTGTAIGATYGVLQSLNPYAIAINMGLNGSILGLSFFGIREYVVSPILITALSQSSPSYAYRLAILKGEDTDVDHLSMMRNNRLIDSAAAGGLAGGAISGFARGFKTLPKAAFTSALITTSLQYITNSVRIARLELLASRSRTRSTSDPTGSGLGTQPSSSFIPTFNNSRSEEVENIQAEEAIQSGKKSLPTRIMDFLTYVSPVRKVSDEEYLSILTRQREDILSDLSPEPAKETPPRSSIWANLTASFGGEKKQSFKDLESQLEGVEKKMESLKVQVERRADNERERVIRG